MTDTAYTGNAIPAPSYRKGGKVVDTELMYSMHNYTQKGVTLKPGQGVLKAGTFLAQDPATKQYVKSTVEADILGVLRQSTDTGSDAGAQTWMANILYAGIIKLPLVEDANSGVVLTNVLSATVNEAEGFFKF